ncbi:hypothetical protein HAX54_039277, partial [Datura stramonium]|nr:hypothetical protein [Datura stramonium]
MSKAGRVKLYSRKRWTQGERLVEKESCWRSVFLKFSVQAWTLQIFAICGRH